uniref:Lipase_3 domain-containing protein n=1 Tax=Steinernema glaseri TaxID=37863 RepID=A0A1I7ZJC3_9BILA
MILFVLRSLLSTVKVSTHQIDNALFCLSYILRFVLLINAFDFGVGRLLSALMDDLDCVATESCNKAGTDSDLIPRFGYVNKENKLLYALYVKPVKGDSGNNFEKNDRYHFTYDVSEADFAAMEKICHNEAIWPLWNQTVYEDCFHTNFLYIKMYEVGHMPDWKPQYIHVSFWFTLKKGDILEHASSFSFRPSCDHDWVHGSGEHFVCRDEPQRWSEYIRRANGFEKGTKYECDNNNKRFRGVNDRS